jgi:hypothetical protein
MINSRCRSFGALALGAVRVPKMAQLTQVSESIWETCRADTCAAVTQGDGVEAVLC